MANLKDDKWTLVQHTGVRTGHVDFLRAVEEQALRTEHELELVRQVGGLVLDNYAVAADRAEAENYPPSVVGLIPRVPGHFSTHTLQGNRIYIPRHVPAVAP